MTLTKEQVKQGIDVGDFICLDNWDVGVHLRHGDEPVDESYPGCEFRIQSLRTENSLGINIEVTGRKNHAYNGVLWRRVKVIFVGDGEPDVTTGAWLRVG